MLGPERPRNWEWLRPTNHVSVIFKWGKSQPTLVVFFFFFCPQSFHETYRVHQVVESKMSPLRVLIVGASVAGPTAAYWFAKAGATVTVIERFPHLRTNGQNVDIRAIGVTVMRRMEGMEAAVRSKLVPIHGMSLVRSDGRPYGTITPTGDPDRQSLVSEYEIYRGDLGRILYDMTKDHKNVRYVFDEQVTAIHHKDAGEDGAVTVEFANGHPAAEFDLVVAADGASSRTRAIALGVGCTVRDHMQPVNAWAAYFSISQDLLNGSLLGHGYTAVGGRFIAIASGPSGGNRVTLMGIYPPSSPALMAPFREALAGGEQAVKRFIADQFACAGWKTDEVLSAMLDASRSTDFYATEMVQMQPPSLYKGRVALVGDAGYASGPTGMGTSLAMAGAYILAGEVCQHSQGDEIGRGLKAYQERMRPILDKFARIPPGIPGVFAPYTAWGLWLRNAVFAVVCWSRMLEVVRRVSSAGAFALNGERYKKESGLPEYDFGES